MSWFYVVATLVAAMLIGFGFVLQQHAAEQVRTDGFLRPGLIARLARNRRWLGGIAALVVGDLVGAWTLGHLALSITEPLLTTNLIFALVLAVPLSGQPLRRAEIIGALLLTAGVAALSATRTVKAPGESFGSFSHWPVAALIAVVAAVLVYLGRRRTGVVRATLTGAASGLVFGIADALTRTSVQTLDGLSPAHLLATWPGYATIATSLVGLWLMQNAFSAAPLHASLPAVTAAEPTSGIVLGVVVFGDVVHVSPWLLAAQAVSIVAIVGGVILVARAPVFRALDLRQLPQVALERIQHPGLHAPARGSGAEPTTGGGAGDIRLLPGGKTLPSPAGKSLGPGGRQLPPHGNDQLPPHGNEQLPPHGNELAPPHGNEQLAPPGDASLVPEGKRPEDTAS